jgi:hypothetical protein
MPVMRAVFFVMIVPGFEGAAAVPAAQDEIH